MVSTQPFFQSSAMKIHDLTTKMMAKMPRITRNCESWVRRSGGENRFRCPLSLYWVLLPDSVQYTPPSASVPPNTWVQEPFSPSARIPRIDARTGKR